MSKGTGTLDKLPSGRWRARFSLHGRRITATFKTHGAARTWLAEKRIELEKGEIVEPSRMTLTEWINAWLADNTPRWAPKTAHSYRQILETYVVPQLGSVRLQQLSPREVAAWHLALSNRVSPALADRARRYLSICLNAALALDMIPRSPIRSRRNTSSRVAAPERPTWTVEQVARILAWCSIKDTELATYIRLAVVSGARRSELWGLRPEDVSAKGLHFRQAVTYVNGSPRVGPPKTGPRLVPLDPESLQLALQLAHDRKGSMFLWGAPSGGPVNESRFMARFREACESAKVPVIGIASLRSVWATLTEGKAPMTWLAARAGHSPMVRVKHYVRPGTAELQATAIPLNDLVPRDQIRDQTEKIKEELKKKDGSSPVVKSP